MVNNAVKLCALLFFSASIFMFSGCSDKDYYNPTDPDPNEPIEVGSNPSNLDFSTTQSVKLNLNYDAPKGHASEFDVYADNPFDANGTLRTDLKPIAGGINVVGVSELTRVIPSYVKKLYVYSSDPFVPILSYAEIANGVASFEAMDVSNGETSRSSFTTRAGNAGPDFWKKPVIKYLKVKEDFYQETANGHIKFDLIQPDMIKAVPVEVTTLIGNTFKENKIPDERFIKDANLRVVNAGPGRKGAKIYITVLASNASWLNSLSYFVYTGSKDVETKFDDLTAEEVAQLELINVLPLARLNTYGSDKKGLSHGTYVQLFYKNENGEFVEEFPEGSIVGWRLGGNSFNENTFEERFFSYAGCPLSVSAWNEAKENSKKGPSAHPYNQTIYFSANDNEGNTYNCFGFEDRRTESDEDYNDLIFHVHTDPADALDPPPAIEEEDITKTESYNGILAFEDFWPKQGDYDMNDVVVKYNSTVTYVYKVGKDKDGNTVTSTEPMVSRVEDVFSMIHTGATYNNAFSYKVNIPSSKVTSVTIDGEAYTIIPDGDGFIIDLCPNVKGVIEAMVYGVTPKVYTVVMEFEDDKVAQDGFSALAAPYNPFISPEPTTGAEIHLSMYVPTSRANRSYFGTWDDRSDQNTLWYVSGENNKYPFAIHLSGVSDEFVVPVEKEKIYVTYPRYSSWVESNMTSDKDWYLYPAK